MKHLSWLSLPLIPILALTGCLPASRMAQSTPEIPLLSPTILPATTTPIPTIIATLTPAFTDTETPKLTATAKLPAVTASKTATPTPENTLAPELVRATIQPLLKDPLNCGPVPCTLTMSFTNHASATQQWAAYSPQALIKQYGKPSRVAFGAGFGQDYTVAIMILYYDASDLIIRYWGEVDFPASFELCPLIAPFSQIRIWMGADAPDTPSYDTVPLEKATLLTIDQFTQLNLGDPQKACFIMDRNAFP